jgi:hypothetical protein
VEIWVVATPPPTRLVAPPPPTLMEESSSSSNFSSVVCPHVKEVSSYELHHFNCLVQLLNVHVHFQIQKLEKIKQLQQARKDNQALARYINAKMKKDDARKKEDARKKVEEACKKAEEGQSTKDVRTWRK